MHVAAGPHEFMGMKARLLGNHPREQRGFENVEGKAQAKIARTLEQQAGEPADAAEMKLISHMAGRQRHENEVGEVQGGKDMPTRPRMVAKDNEQCRNKGGAC